MSARSGTGAPDGMKSSAPPRISVITPSFNQAEFLEQTIRSVVEQGYPNLEYFVVDGGSTDGSREIIKQHASHISWWTSETDRGQTHAINKGLSRATGQILCWLNSDDYFPPDTLRFVSQCFEPGVDVVVGHCLRIDTAGQTSRLVRGGVADRADLLRFWKPVAMHQPSIFWRKTVTDRIGLLDESLHYAMDYEYWLRMSREFSFRNVDRTLSHAHLHARAKTADDWRYQWERRRVVWREVRRAGGTEVRRFVLDFLAHGLAHEAAFLVRPAFPLKVRRALRRFHSP